MREMSTGRNDVLTSVKNTQGLKRSGRTARTISSCRKTVKSPTRSIDRERVKYSDRQRVASTLFLVVLAPTVLLGVPLFCLRINTSNLHPMNGFETQYQRAARTLLRTPLLKVYIMNKIIEHFYHSIAIGVEEPSISQEKR